MAIDDVVLLLANAADQPPGNVMISALGIGWSMTSSPTAPSALLLFIKVPWGETNVKHQIALSLVDGDGRPALMNDEPVHVEIEFEAGRPPGLVRGQSIDWAHALNLPPLELRPGRYVWRLTLDGEPKTSRDFTVGSAGGA